MNLCEHSLLYPQSNLKKDGLQIKDNDSNVVNLIGKDVQEICSQLIDNFRNTDDYEIKIGIIKKLHKIAENNESDKEILHIIDDTGILNFALETGINPKEPWHVRAKGFELIGVAKDQHLIKDLLTIIDNGSKEIEEDTTAMDWYASAFWSLISCTLEDIPYSHIRSEGVAFLEHLKTDFFLNREALKSLGGKIESVSKKPFNIEIEAFEKLQSMYPKTPIIYRILGYCYNAKGNFDKAIESYKRLVDLDPQTKYRKNLAINYLRKGVYNKAIEELEERIRAASDDLEAYRIIAIVFIKTGKFEDAEKISKRGLKVNPLDDGLHLAMAQSLLGRKKYDEAIEEIREAIRILKDEVEKIKGDGEKLAESYSLAGPIAHIYTPGVTKTMAQFFIYHLVLSDCYYLKGDYKEAKNILEFIIENSSKGLGIEEQAERYLERVNQSIKDKEEKSNNILEQ